MRFSVKNLGFIKSGHFETNDLTIIFGKNNSGKTYLSYVTYILSQDVKENLMTFGRNSLGIEDKIKSSNGEVSFLVSISEILNEDRLSSINTIMKYSLSKNFNVSDGYFAKTDLKFDFDSLFKKAEESSFNLVLSNRFVDTVIFIAKEKNSKYINVSSVKSNEHNSNLNAGLEEKSFDAIRHYFYNYQIPEAIINQIADCDIKNPFVITSERTGIEMFYKEMDNNRSNIAENLTITKLIKSNKNKKIKQLDEITENQLSKYSKPISDNIKVIRNQQETRKYTSEIQKEKNFKYLHETLRKITRGQFKTNNLGDTIYVMDGSDKHEIPLHAASSSIKSMTMIDLYINHIASVGETLIIDEPELNLHPDNQILMAEIIVRLLNVGVKIIMTTHSDYLVREINNRIKLFSADKKNKLYKDFSSGDFDILDSSRVNIFNILPTGVIEQVNVSKHGIDSVIFDEVIISSSEREDLIASILGE